MSVPDLKSRIQRLLDGELSAAEFAALEDELLANPEALEIYRSFVSLHCGLQAQHEFQSNVLKMPVVPIDRVIALQRRQAIKTSLVAAAALFVLLGIVMWLVSSPDRPVSFASFQTAPGSSFTLAHSGEGERPLDGKLAEGSRIILDHGVAELDLPHDVRAIIEAPATLTLVDDRSVDLERGRAFFEVQSPDGHGFTVITPNQKIVDLGTAFGVDLPVGSDQTHLHVFEGSVRIEGPDAGGTGEVIRAPMSVSIRGIRVLEQLEESADRFRRRLPDRVETLLVEDFEAGLLAGRDYAVHMDPTAILDQAGNRFAGISENAPWRFSTSKELMIRNASFEAAEVSGGIPVPHWHEVTGARMGFNTYRKQPKPTEGALHLSLIPDRTLAQDLGVPITAGITYNLTLDIGNEPSEFPGQAVVRFFGSDAGFETPLTEIRVDPPQGAWLRNQTLSFAASTWEATGQTLGISLSSRNGRITFDDLRISETRAIDQVKSSGSFPQESTLDGQPDTNLPLVSSFDPAPDASNAPFEGSPTLVFDEPVRFGTGRIIVRNLTDYSETQLIVGSERTSLRSRVLTFLPPLGLEDGAGQIGGIPGWECSGPVSRFNPSGSGHRYRHPDLADDSKARGTFDSMKGPILATLGTRGQPATIRRSLGKFENGRTYTVSVGIGCRSRSPDAADTSPFAGYRIRLLCDSVVLAGISDQSPPGPPDSVTPVGFSWDSREFQGHLAAEAPLVLEISSLGDANEDGGSLDLDHVQVTSLGGVER